MRRRWRSALLACSLAATTAAADHDPAISGVIADHTRTPAGHTLYRAFLRVWQLRNGYPEINLTVREQASPRGGTIITVEHEQRVLFQAPASGSRGEPTRVAAAAAEAVERQMASAAGNRDRDLDGRDELR